MTDKSRVHVSDVNVKQGIRKSEGYCAVACAIRDTLGSDHDAADIEVGADWVLVRQAHGRWWAETPEGMAEFIAAFDSARSEGQRQELMDRAVLGQWQWPLTWHEGEPPYEEF